MMTHESVDVGQYRDDVAHSYYGALAYLIDFLDAGALLHDRTDIFRILWHSYSEVDDQVFQCGGVNTKSSIQTSTICPDLDICTAFHDDLKLFGVVK